MTNIDKKEGSKKDDFLIECFGGAIGAIQFEQFFYAIASDKMKNYDGGLWDLYEVSNSQGTAPLFMLSGEGEDDKQTLLTSYSEVETNTHTASLGLFSMAINHYSFSLYGKPQFEALSEKLLEYGAVLREYGFEDDVNAIDTSALFYFLD